MPESAPAPHPQSHSPAILIIGIIAVLAGAAMAVMIFIYGEEWIEGQPLTNVNQSVQSNQNASKNLNQSTNTNAPAANSNSSVNNNTNTSASDFPSGDVTWHTPREIVNPNLLGKSDYGYDYDQNSKYYETGTIATGPYTNGVVILASVTEEGPSFYPTYYYLARNEAGKYFFLTNNSDGDWNIDYGENILNGIQQKGVTIDRTTVLTDLNWPEDLTGTNAQQTLRADSAVNAFFSNDSLQPLFVHPFFGQAYTNEPVPSSADDSMLGRTGINSRNGIYFRAPDGTVRVYYLQPDFLTADQDERFTGTINITWNSGQTVAQKYFLTLVSGCGGTNYANVIAPQDIDPDTDLVKTGTASNGDAIYEEKDRNSQRLRDFYDTTYQVFEGVKAPWETFLADHPLIYWIDPYDRLIELTSDEYRPAVECGKPVIYLYPTKPTLVSVQLKPQGGFTKTEPPYGQGWNVLAHPDGRLIEQQTGQAYPYLFWEGLGGIYETPPQGFVVSQGEIHSFLLDSLNRLGLNQQETSDFIEFWEPKMQGSPYYFVTFMGNRVADLIAPMTVNPTPDTIIRILMDYRPLSQPIPVESFPLHAPIRRGFTVVEWGGVLR